MAYELELPSIYLDAGVEDAASSVVGETPVLINCDPEQNELRVARATDIQLDIATVGPAGVIDLSGTQIYVNGVLAFAAGVFQGTFTGSYSNPQADVLRVFVQPATQFTSEQVVSVRVVSNALGDSNVLDTTYSFTIEDFTAPTFASAVAQDLQTIRVTFSEAVMETTDDAASSALTFGNYTLQRLGDYMTPLVSANIVGAVAVTTTMVDLSTDIPLTPGGTYRIYATQLEDASGNPVDTLSYAEFVAWTPPQPNGRLLDLYAKLPQVNQNEDETGDLYRLVACVQEVVNLLLWDIDRFIDILDPDIAPEDWVDQMLLDLGNPFAFELQLIDKRRLAQILIDIYQLKGTRIGIVNVARFFMGLEVTVVEFNLSVNTWVLGESELGDTTYLGSSVPHDIFSFTVSTTVDLTDTQRSQLSDIVNYMKPAHTHFLHIDEP